MRLELFVVPCQEVPDLNIDVKSLGVFPVARQRTEKRKLVRKSEH